jgi:glucose-1-phosphate thymidylyltransferase
VNATKAVILAQDHRPSSSPGRRSFARGELAPPPLLPVANRPLLEHALEWLGSGGVREVAVLASEGTSAHTSRSIVTGGWGFDLTWIERPHGAGLGTSLATLGDFLRGEPFILHLADSLSRVSLGALAHNERAGDDEAILFVHETAGHGGGVVDLRSRRSASPFEGDCEPAGVAILGAGVAEVAEELDAAPGHELEHLADYVQRGGGQVRTRRVGEWWRLGHDADALLEGNRFALEGIPADYASATLTRTSIQGSVVAHRSAVIESSVVRGPVIIGPGARITHSYVGPYTSIGRDVTIEGSEVEHSIVFPGARIQHLASRLEASVVGAGARVFREFRLPRAMRVTVGDGAEVSLA